MPAGATVTLCAIDTAKWVEQADVADDAKVTCPPCAKAMKDAAKNARGEEVAATKDAAADEQAGNVTPIRPTATA